MSHQKLFVATAEEKIHKIQVFNTTEWQWQSFEIMAMICKKRAQNG